MKHPKLFRNMLPVFMLALLFACTGQRNKKSADQSGQSQPKEITVNAESQALLNYLAEQGDYAGSRNFPSMIAASEVFAELDSNNLIIDLRDKNTYEQGHIRGSVNVAFNDLPDYFSNNIKPSGYKRIILVCHAGQISGYSTSLLRLMGYSNVYSMKWGMSSWNKKFAEDWWLSKVSNENQDKIETTVNEKGSKNDLPVMHTGETTGKAILAKRIKAVFAAGYRDAMIPAADVFKDPSKYYILNYDRRDKYESGHIPGAIRYKPGETLGYKDEMETLPSDRDLVVYCNTGQSSAFVTAYLRLFGYNAKSLLFGNNSFMHDRMVKDKKTLSWVPFTDADIENYPYVKNQDGGSLR